MKDENGILKNGEGSFRRKKKSFNIYLNAESSKLVLTSIELLAFPMLTCK